MRLLSNWKEYLTTGRIRLALGDGIELDTDKIIAAAAPVDSGWRAMPVAAGSTARTGTGTMLVRRIGDRVTWRFNELGLVDGSGAAIVIHSGEWANGLTPYAQGPVFHVSHEAGSTYTSKLKVASSLYWLSVDTGTSLSSTRTNVALQGEFSYLTDDPVPATWPGTPA